MITKYRFPIIIEKDEDGYFASCPALQGCYTQGDTYEEALANIHDAIELYLEDMSAEKEEIREPKDVIFSSVEVSITH